jgi:hypothetical protein
LTNAVQGVDKPERDRPATENKHLKISPISLARGNESLRDWLGDGKDSVTVIDESLNHAVLSILRSVLRCRIVIERDIQSR